MAEVEIEQRGAVRIVRINRPEARNALSPTVVSGLGTAVVEADADPTVQAIIITGTGDRAFCAGMDLRAFAEGSSGSASPEGAAAYQRLIRESFPTLIIGAANGSAV